jgi:K(+)-stimulated pyrophosphate-energized sodium pump
LSDWGKTNSLFTWVIDQFRKPEHNLYKDAVMMNFFNSAANWMVGGLPVFLWLVPLSALVSLATAYYFFRSVMSHDEGTTQMIDIARAVREGAMAYLIRQYRVIALVFGVLFVLFLIMSFFRLLSPVTPFAFLLGGLFSALSGFIGMYTATSAGARTAYAASRSLNGGLQVAFRGGAVMGFSVVGFTLLSISILFFTLYFLVPAEWYRGFERLHEIATIMVSGVFGASAVALFARVGGGIFTKAADVGADLVGKVEANIPEDDPRNPAVIADNVGDTVGDVAGMGADLYESFMGSILATVVLGVSAVVFRNGDQATQLNYLAMPMVLAALGVFMSMLGVRLVRVGEEGSMHDLMTALERGIQGASVGVAVIALPLVYFLQLERPLLIWGVVVTGLLVGIIIGRATDYFTSHAYQPTRGIAAQGSGGPATVLIDGLAVGMRSTAIPVLVTAVGIGLSFFLAGGATDTLMGLYGIGLAAVAMLSTLGITLSTDAYGPIADNAGGNAQMAGLPPDVRARTDQLDAVGNTTAATGKGFAIGSAALTALALLAAFMEQVRLEMIYLLEIPSLEVMGNTIAINEMTLRDFTVYYDVTPLNPALMLGLFIGSMVVFYFTALTMSAVGRAAGEMVQEVRRQFECIPGLMQGTAKPDYARCVDISTASAQREMIAPAMVAIIVPIVMGLIFGVAGVIGLLAGSLATGFVMALMMANSGGAWDNAKKYVEEGNHGGRGSMAHKATVVGDTVGDPFKDTSGPSINILIKLMGIVAIITAGLTAYMGPGGLLGSVLTWFA